MSSVIITQTRPSENVDFFVWGYEVAEHLLENYIQPGKIIGGIDVMISPDNLIKTAVIRFNSEQSRLEYRDDPIIVESRMRKEEYNAINGITEHISTLEN